jgi:hypothetical protein
VPQTLNPAHFDPAVNLKFDLERNGFAILPNCLDPNALERLRTDFPEGRSSDRNILPLPSVNALATSRSVGEIVEKILGPECFAVRGIFFNKTRLTNWKVVWHQDLTIAVREQRPADGFGPWSQPPSFVMSGMLAIRLHLDESDCDNGPLRVIPGTHRHSRLSAAEIAAFAKDSCATAQFPRVAH